MCLAGICRPEGLLVTTGLKNAEGAAGNSALCEPGARIQLCFDYAVQWIRATKGKIMKYTTVKISEIAAHPTMRLDPGYWLKKKKKIRAKPQAASYKLKKSI